MKTRYLALLVCFSATVLFSYTSASAQDENKVKDTVKKAKDVTVETTKKTTVVVTDVLSTTAEKTKDAVVGTAKVGASTVKKFGNNTVEVTENVVGTAYEGGRWLTVTTWNGTKWVSKRVWFATKKTAEAVKEKIDND